MPSTTTRRRPVPTAFLVALLLLGVLTSASQRPAFCGVADDAPRRPNIVVILADDLGYGDLGCYGNQEINTPHLDKLAAGGMRFTDFHSSGPVCSPTRAGLVTGRYQQRAGVPGVIYADPKANRHHGLQLSEITFAEMLAPAGYRTGVMGKWHLGYEPQFNPRHQGFDVFRGYVSGNIDYISHYDRMEIYDWWHDEEKVEEPGYSTHLISRHAVKFIDENHDRPFCLYVAHEAPHSPFQGPGDPPQRGPNKAQEKLGPDRIARARREMIEEMDRGVGDVVAALERHDLRDSTLVFFLSDNGAERNGSNGPLNGYKGSLWEGGHRVPAIANWPGVVEPGAECDALTISLDVTPTLLDLAGVAPPRDRPLDGRSLRPLLEGGKPAESRRLFWQYGPQGAVRDGRWKLLMQGESPPRLYDLSRDLGETTDLSADQPDRVERLQTAYAAWRKDVETGAAVQPEKPASK
ncbi:MAG: sulfatase [Pirellulaceae bacterium]